MEFLYSLSLINTLWIKAGNLEFYDSIGQILYIEIYANDDIIAESLY